LPGSTATPTPFANNIIPAGRINLTSAKLLNLWPAPNNAGASTNNFTTVASTGGDQNQLVWRLDHNLKNRQRLFFRLSYWNVLDLPIDPLGSGLCADRCSENYHSSAMAAGYTHAFTPTVIFGFNFSVSRFRYNRNPKNSGFDLTKIGWPASYNQSVPAVMRTPPDAVRREFADNIICTQGQSFIQDRNTQYNLSPSISMLRGRHQYQFGSQFEVGRDNYAQSNIASGAFDFCAPGRACFTSLPGVSGTAFRSQISCSGMPAILTTSKSFFCTVCCAGFHCGTADLPGRLFCRFLACNEQANFESGLALRPARTLVGAF